MKRYPKVEPKLIDHVLIVVLAVPLWLVAMIFTLVLLIGWLVAASIGTVGIIVERIIEHLFHQPNQR